MKLLKGFLIILITILIVSSSSNIYAWNTPTQNSPVNNSLSWNFIEFNWSPVFYSNAYQIQVDTSMNFNSVILLDSIIQYVDTTGYGDTHLNIDDLFFGQTYYWRVRANAANDTSLWSPVWAVTTKDDVELVSPVIGSMNYVSVMLDWNSHIGIDHYNYQLDTSANFNSPVLVSGNDIYFSEQNSFFDSEQTMGNLIYGANYHWRVRAINSIDTSAWSSGMFFTKEFIEVISPIGAALTPTGVLLDWDEFEGTYFYDYEIDINSGFNSSSLIAGSDLSMNNGSGNSDTEEFIDDLFFNTDYFWRVRSRHGSDTSEWVVNTFTTLDNLELVSPISGSNTECEVLFDWNAHPGVDAYEYQIDYTTLFNSSNLISGQRTYINTQNTNTDTEVLAGPLLFGTQYFWRVRALNASDTSSWSYVWSVNTLDEIILTAPNNSASTFTTVVFDWEDFAGANEYVLVVDTSALFNSPLSVTSNIIGSSEKTAEQMYFGYNYFWKVRGKNSIDVSGWSEIRSFFTYNEVGLFTPNNGELNADTLGVYLDWWYHHGASEYQLEIDTSNMFNTNFLIQESFSYIAPVANGPDTEYLTGPLENNKIYFWRVRVINEVDTSNWETRWFNTGSYPLILPEIPVLISPLYNEMDVTIDPVLDWSDVSGVSGYYYEYSKFPDFSISESDFITASQLNLVALDYVTEYYWRVRSFDGNLVSNWTNAFKFTTAQEELDAPNLISPIDGTSGVQVDNVFFNWSDVFHAQTYELVYSSTDNFLFDVVNQIVIQSEFNTNGLQPGTTYYWKVRTLNDTLINSIYSDVWSFTTQLQLEIPVLLSPLNNSFNNPYNNLSLSWELVPNAEGYFIQYARDNGFTLDLVEEISVNPYLIVVGLDDNTTYFWRVKSTSATLYDSEYTYTWSFTTEEDTTNSISIIGDSSFNLYPNPTNGMFSIDLGGLNLLGNSMVKVFDYTGREIIVFNSTESILQLDISEYHSGIYFISVMNNGVYYYDRILKK